MTLHDLIEAIVGEYQEYVPEILGLVKAKADRQEIANRFHKLETENMEMSGIIENCLNIVDKRMPLINQQAVIKKETAPFDSLFVFGQKATNFKNIPPQFYN